MSEMRDGNGTCDGCGKTIPADDDRWEETDIGTIRCGDCKEKNVGTEDDDRWVPDPEDELEETNSSQRLHESSHAADAVIEKLEIDRGRGNDEGCHHPADIRCGPETTHCRAPLCSLCNNPISKEANTAFGCVLYAHPPGPDGGEIDNWYDSWEENGFCSAKCAAGWLQGIIEAR